MATKTNLEQRVAEQAANLDPAQCEFVMAELKTYLWNKGQIESIERDVKSGMYDLDDERKAIGERHQLVNENSALFGHIMKWLKDTAPEEADELGEFIGGA